MVKRLKNNLSKRRTRQNTLRRKSTRRKSVRRNNRTLRRKSFKRLKGGGWIYHGKCHGARFGKKGRSRISLDLYPNIAGMRRSATDKTEYKLAIESPMGNDSFQFAESPYLRYSQILSMFKKGKKFAGDSDAGTINQGLLKKACAEPYEMLDKFGPTKYIGKISKDKCEKRLQAIQRAMYSLIRFVNMYPTSTETPLESVLKIFNFDKILEGAQWEIQSKGESTISHENWNRHQSERSHGGFLSKIQMGGTDYR